MPKAILEFQLPEEQDEFKLATQAQSLHLTIWDLDQYLRNLIKHPPDTMSDETYDALEATRQKLRDLCIERGIEL